MKIPFLKTSLFYLLVTAIVFTWGSSVYSQDKASDWFERGLNATNPDSRIAAFERAVTNDPDYVEAYFYLGLAYKQKNMLHEAELTLHKAYFKNPYALNNEIKTRILFELGVIKSNLGKTVEALDSFKSAKATAGNNNALTGRIQYEFGLAYIRNGDYQLALKELREGRDLIPQSSDLFNKAIAEAQSNKNVLKTYNKGLTLLLNGKYQQAIQQFEQVIRQNVNFKDVQAKLSEAKKNQTESNTNKRINEIYQQALSAKQKNNNQLALRLFQQVAKEDPDFRDVANELTQLQNSQPVPAQKRTTDDSEVNQRVARDRKLDNLYNEGLDFLANKDWGNALDRLRDVQKIRPGYKKVEQKILDLKQAIATEKQMLAAIDSLYQKGALAFQSKDWPNALLIFEKLDALKPGHRDTGEKLLEAKLNFNKKNLDEESDTKQQNLILIASVVFLSLLIPVAGVLIFSPTLKARMYLLKGDYDNAARLLEQILERRPEKVKLYPLLAHIYLLEDKQDETALKTYEMILKLNISTPKKAQINSIVANHYLRSGTIDSNAIDIMEKELSSKINKLQSGTAD